MLSQGYPRGHANRCAPSQPHIPQDITHPNIALGFPIVDSLLSGDSGGHGLCKPQVGNARPPFFENGPADCVKFAIWRLLT